METTYIPKTRKKTIFPPPFLPYDWQSPIIKIMIDTILAGENGLVVQPTATGKSVEAAFTARSCTLLHNMRGLYLYDENEGLEQARKSFEHIFGKNEITCANFFGYGKDHSVDSADMVFASFQSLNNHHNKWYTMFNTTHFDFIIVNEAHCGQAVSYKEVIDYFNCPKIGMTATPERMDGKNVLEIFDKIIFEMSLEEAIVKGYVAGIEYHIKSHGLSTKKINDICREYLEEGKRVSINQLNETIFIDLLDDEVLKEIYSYAFPEDDDPRQTLIFCENIAHANRVGELLARDGKKFGVIHSKLGKGYNRSMMKQFRKETIQFLVSIDKLNEDIDVPNVQLAAFWRATDSKTVFLQQLGRSLRKHPKKEKAIILDFVGNCQRLIFVREMQERVLEFAKKEGLESLYENNTLNVSGNGFDFQFSDEIVDVMKMISAIREGYYKNWQEASKAAIALKIRSSTEYFLKYRFDSKLPSDPDYYLDFPGFKVFLGTLKYPTWQEASEAAIALGIKNQAEYFKKYKLDPRLKINLNRIYPDFPGYEVFLGTGNYKTWQEASKAAIALNIKDVNGYREKHKLDPKLPSNPNVSYPDFPGIIIFLGGEISDKKYSTWQEASKKAVAMGIKSKEEYNQKYKRNSFLPTYPHEFYPNFPGYEVFLSAAKYPTWQEASEAAIALGIISEREYTKKHKLDTKLPGKLETYYKDFPGYNIFLNTGKYKTWQEASKAAIVLGVKTHAEYIEIYKIDPRLVRAPHMCYSDFPGYNVFFGKSKSKD